MKEDLYKSNNKNVLHNSRLSQIEFNSKYIKLVEAFKELMVSCHPQDYFISDPPLKEIWRWYKNIMEEFFILKKIILEV